LANQTHSVITFATNKFSYVQFALNCAQSILIHNDIPIFIVSNLDFSIPAKYKDKIFIVPAKPEHLPLGIGMKLHIDEYLQTEHSLFIDSDCICYGNLTEIFKAAEGMDITVVGNIVATENWCGREQANTIKQNFGIDKIIRFNGGLYYIKKSALTTAIFDKAREIGEKYDSYGFERIKDKWINEEGPVSISMMLHKQTPMPDNGHIITDLFTDNRPAKINVLTGARQLRNRPRSHQKHRPWYPDKYMPLLIHFGGNNISSYPYKSQKSLLKLKSNFVPAPIAAALVNVFIHAPYKTYHFLHKYLKPGNNDVS
jgi:hypothetical protein